MKYFLVLLSIVVLLGCSSNPTNVISPQEQTFIDCEWLIINGGEKGWGWNTTHTPSGISVKRVAGIHYYKENGFIEAFGMVSGSVIWYLSEDDVVEYEEVIE